MTKTPRRKLDQDKRCRDEKTANGYCVRGRDHGPPRPGRTECDACNDKRSAREKQRRSRVRRLGDMARGSAS